MKPEDVFIENYSYELPHERIAQRPLEQRDGSRLLVYQNGGISDAIFKDLPELFLPNTTIVANNTRVIEARIFFEKETGGIIEIFCLQPEGTSLEQAMENRGEAVWSCLVGGASKWKLGLVLRKKLADGWLEANYVEKRADDFLIRFAWEPEQQPFSEIISQAGSIPLPPYMKRQVEHTDLERYQTVFNKSKGSVAAPTAALHFTPEVLDRLNNKGINISYLTLHVGAGTFKPVKSETIAGHRMHGEPFSVSRSLVEELLTGKQVIAVGTTSMRSLESLYWIGVKLLHNNAEDQVLTQWEAYELQDKYGEVPVEASLNAILRWMEQKNRDTITCNTSLLIYPGYQFRIPVGLITNFHQPGSTLLLLIAAFIGEDWKKVYKHALDNGYRFLSYGDSSLLFRNK